MDMQKIVDLMNVTSKQTRARYQMTLGKLIAELSECAPTDLVVFGGEDEGSPGSPDSYRGYYSDLSFDSAGKPITVAEFKATCEKAVGETFQGYKGGDYKMDNDTPLWVAQYGCCGHAIMRVMKRGGKVILATQDVERD